MKCKLIRPWPAAAAPGEIECHYGHSMTVQEDGSLVGDIDDEMAIGEIEAGRMIHMAEDPADLKDPAPAPPAPKAPAKEKEKE